MAAGAPQTFLPLLLHFTPGGAGQPRECGRRGEALGWEKYRESVPLLPLATDVWSFALLHCSRHINYLYDTAFFFY